MAAETVAYVASRSKRLAALFASPAATRRWHARGRNAVQARARVRPLPPGPGDEGRGRGRLRSAAAPGLLLRRRAEAEEPFGRACGSTRASSASSRSACSLAGSSPEVGSDRSRSTSATYLVTQWAAFPLYLVRAIVAVRSAFYRYHPPAAWPPDAFTIGWGLVALVVAALAFRFRREAPEWSCAVACCRRVAACRLPSSRSTRWSSTTGPISAVSASRSPWAVSFTGSDGFGWACRCRPFAVRAISYEVGPG